MNSRVRLSVALGLTLAVSLSGCSRKTDAKTEMEKAANSLADTQTAAAPAQPEAPVRQVPAATVAPVTTPAQEMNQAMVAYKAGHLEDAVMHLQELRATPTITPQQRVAVNDAMAAVMSDTYALAAKGDSRAIQAVRQYELMRHQRH